MCSMYDQTCGKAIELMQLSNDLVGKVWRKRHWTGPNDKVKIFDSFFFLSLFHNSLIRNIIACL